MPAPLPLPVRLQIWGCFQDGQDAATIADALGLSRRTVQHLLQRYRLRGPTGVQPDYHASPSPATVDACLKHEALFLRRHHTTWGAGFIRVRLQDRHPDADLPSERTLQRWFRQAAPPGAPPGRKPARQRHTAQEPHAVWEIDASERMRLQTDEQVSWLRGVDEYTGAVLGTRVFPPRALVSGPRPANPSGFPPVFLPLGAAAGRAGR